MHCRSLYSVRQAVVEGLVAHTLRGQLFVINHVDEVLVRRRILALDSLRFLCIGSLGRVGIERDSAILVI